MDDEREKHYAAMCHKVLLLTAENSRLTSELRESKTVCPFGCDGGWIFERFEPDFGPHKCPHCNND